MNTRQTIEWDEANARRLARQGLAEPLRGHTHDDVAALMGGAHAQVLSAAEHSIAVRMADSNRTDVREALFQRRSLVKTYGPRGTVHLLATRDLPLWTGALSAGPAPRNPFPEGVRLTATQSDQVVEAVGSALEDAELTLEELDAAVVERAGAWAGDLVMPAFQTMWPRWRQAITTAAHRGLLCFGANRGRNVTYTNPHRWLGAFQPLDGDQALAELVRRYLHGYGPATAVQFAQWFGMQPKGAANLFAAMGDQLEPVDFDGAPAWLVAGDTSMPPPAATGIRLLPYFDAFAVASHPRSRLFPARATERALSPSGQAGNYPVVLINGIVGGVWHQRRSGRTVHVTVEMFGRLTAPQRRALDVQVERIADIVEGQARLTIGPVTVGGHA